MSDTTIKWVCKRDRMLTMTMFHLLTTLIIPIEQYKANNSTYIYRWTFSLFLHYSSLRQKKQSDI
jgi:hypothetical protein